MLIHNLRYFILASLSALALAATPASSDDCFQHFLRQKDLAVLKMASEVREGLVDLLRKENIPAFLKQTRNGEIPVILVNGKSVKSISGLLDETAGTQIYLQPDWNNDHGGFRLFRSLIDLDTPGARGYGELHATGISWKPIDSYVPRRAAGSDVIIEVAYALSREEKEIFDYYHRVRRAALVRVPFTFGGVKANLGQANMLPQAGEHCFLYCKGTQVRNIVSGIVAELHKYGIQDPESFLKHPDVDAFLKSARKKILAADLWDGNELGPRVATSRDDLALLQNVMPADVREDQRWIFANWLIGLDAASGYRKALDELQISSDLGVEDMHHLRASAILVYSNDQNMPQAFADATFRSAGKFIQWNNAGQRPIH